MLFLHDISLEQNDPSEQTVQTSRQMTERTYFRWRYRFKFKKYVRILLISAARRTHSRGIKRNSTRAVCPARTLNYNLNHKYTLHEDPSLPKLLIINSFDQRRFVRENREGNTEEQNVKKSARSQITRNQIFLSIGDTYIRALYRMSQNTQFLSLSTVENINFL